MVHPLKKIHAESLTPDVTVFGDSIFMKVKLIEVIRVGL